MWGSRSWLRIDSGTPYSLLIIVHIICGINYRFYRDDYDKRERISYNYDNNDNDNVH